jgi:hypothetical protein
MSAHSFYKSFTALVTIHMLYFDFYSDSFTKLKMDMRMHYDAIRAPVYCRCLNQKVYFNARGFHHLLYDDADKARTVEQARERLQLIPLIVPVLHLAREASYEKRYVRKSKKPDSPLMLVEMWGLQATVGRGPIPVKVVLRREDDGKIFFWSVMRAYQPSRI